MKFDIINAFRGFCNDLSMTKDSLESISKRYRNITKIINRCYWDSDSEVAHSLYVGSYGRGTKIDDSDIDLLVILPYAMYSKYDAYLYGKQSSFLQDVKNSIKKTYSTTDIRADGQIISVKFSDGTHIEVLPAFNNSDGNSFTYADTNNGGGWKVCNPRAEIKAISDMDAITRGNLKRLCKMTRVWRDYHSVNISGIIIDILAYRFLNTWKYKESSFIYYDWMARDFFEYMSNIPEQSKYQVMGSGRYVYSNYHFQYKAKLAYDKALAAIDMQDNYSVTANDYWREIYGARFPRVQGKTT